MIGPIETFQTEAKEHLESLEAALLDLEKDSSNIELINQAFRSAHTIKGGAGMFGFNQLTAFTHHVESVLDRLRTGDLIISNRLIGVLLEIGDFISTLLDDTQFTPDQENESVRLLTMLNSVCDTVETSDSQDPLYSNIDRTDNSGRGFLYRISFSPDSQSLKSGLDVVPILKELSGLGYFYVQTALNSNSLEDRSLFDPELSYYSFECILISERVLSDIDDVFMFVKDDWVVEVDCIDLASVTHCSPDDDFFVRPTHTQITLDSIRLGKFISQYFDASNFVEVDSNIEKGQQENHSKNTVETPKAKQGNDASHNATIRVPAQKLDSLMNLVGELVIVQARLNQFANHSDNEEIMSIAEELDLLTNQMRDETFGIRLIPIGTTFGRYRRLVRDLSVELHKSITLETSGEETELDKMVIDKLSDPLIHIIRNSIDHGIETPEQRQELGKSEIGMIYLKAEHAESHVHITISDDGKGLDPEKIKSKAIDKGIIGSTDELSDEQLHSLIFEPGFSTAASVSDISGRGVGMDVVKRSIQELGGKVSVKSRLGEGTNIKISLPMTLAIIEGLLVKVGIEHFVLPLNSVEECLELTSSMRQENNRIIEVRGQQIPFIILRKHFDVSGERPAIEQIVVLHNDQERFGFCVDEVVGQYQTVIKRLGRFYEGVTGFSGATIMGDGNVAIVLDPQAIIESTSI